MTKVSSLILLFGISLSGIKSDAAEASAGPGYEDGFLVGQTRHDRKEADLEPGRLRMMAATNSHGTSEPLDYQNSFILGYQDGFAGRAKDGIAQNPLPRLPIKLPKTMAVLSKDVGNVVRGDTSPLQHLAALVAKNPEKQIFFVLGEYRFSKQSSQRVKYVYDRKSKNFLMLKCSLSGTSPASYSWSLIFEAPPHALNEKALWGPETRLRQVSSKHDDARETVPLHLDQNPEVAKWP